MKNNIGRSVKFLFKVVVEESIVNAPLVSLQTTHKVRLDLNSQCLLIRDLQGSRSLLFGDL
jgi:hypothetical protein